MYRYGYRYKSAKPGTLVRVSVGCGTGRVRACVVRYGRYGTASIAWGDTVEYDEVLYGKVLSAGRILLVNNQYQ